MQFTSFLEHGQLTIELTGEIDHQCARKYIDAIASKIEIYAPQQCILDFCEVTFMDSSGIAVVLNAMRSITSMGGKIMISGLNDQPLRVFQASGMDKLLEIREVRT